MAPRSRSQSDTLKAQSRGRLLEAARSLFASQGYFATRVGEIARRAGMSQGNVYWHYSSKEEILQEILAEGFGAIEAMTAEVGESPGPARARIELLIERSLALYSAHADFVQILGTLMGHGGQELMASLGFNLAEIGGRYHANVERVFAQARREKAVADVDPNLLARFFFSFFNGALITYPDLWPQLEPALVRQTALRLLGAPKA
jgi:AcrR family transcriptional regulator